MKPLKTAVLLFLIVLGGCSGRYAVEYDSTGDDPPRRDDRKVSRLHIPPGHLPPPGSCRIWVPGVPPGHQSPPGDCDRLSVSVPPGAWLIERPVREPDYVAVRIFDDHDPGVVVDVAIYAAATGDLVGHGSIR